MITYNKENIPLAKVLRKNMTVQERKLWYEFLRIYPIRFQRQKAIGEYIVDFYCAKAKLVIEIDGSQHYETEGKKIDEERTKKLNELGLRVERISNAEINQNFRGVCEYIDLCVKQCLPLLRTPKKAPSDEGAVER